MAAYMHPVFGKGRTSPRYWSAFLVLIVMSICLLEGFVKGAPLVGRSGAADVQVADLRSQGEVFFNARDRRSVVVKSEFFFSDDDDDEEEEKHSHRCRRSGPGCYDDSILSAVAANFLTWQPAREFLVKRMNTGQLISFFYSKKIVTKEENKKLIRSKGINIIDDVTGELLTMLDDKPYDTKLNFIKELYKKESYSWLVRKLVEILRTGGLIP